MDRIGKVSLPPLNKEGRELLEEVRKAYNLSLVTAIGNNRKGDDLPEGSEVFKLLYRTLKSIDDGSYNSFLRNYDPYNAISTGTFGMGNSDSFEFYQKVLSTKEEKVLAVKAVTYLDEYYASRYLSDEFNIMSTMMRDWLHEYDVYLNADMQFILSDKFAGRILCLPDITFRFFRLLKPYEIDHLMYNIPRFLPSLRNECGVSKDPLLQWIYEGGEFPYNDIYLRTETEIETEEQQVAYRQQYAVFDDLVARLVGQYESNDVDWKNSINIYSITLLSHEFEPITIEELPDYATTI